jgi:hypothetical protein
MKKSNSKHRYYLFLSVTVSFLFVFLNWLAKFFNFTEISSIVMMERIPYFHSFSGWIQFIVAWILHWFFFLVIIYVYQTLFKKFRPLRTSVFMRLVSFGVFFCLIGPLLGFYPEIPQLKMTSIAWGYFIFSFVGVFVGYSVGFYQQEEKRQHSH